MPGNEVGDRIHNFLGQESLSQGQHHSQVIDGTWPGLSNNLWVGSQRQVGGPLVSSLKNFSVNQLAESDRGHGGQSSSLQHGLSFTQSAFRPEIARSQSQNQPPFVNGYMQGHQSFQARQGETNFLGVDTASRGLSALDSQIGNSPDLHKKNSLRLESNESPVNYDFFGGQQQISGQHPGMIQPLPRQQSGMTDVQVLQQNAMLKQMQEFQRQQLQKPQFQLPEARQLSSANQVSSVVKQGSGSLSPAPINGVPVHDATNYSWQPEHMTPNANWLQHGASPAMLGSSSGFMFSPEQGQVRLMGLVPQQVDPSFFGISSSGARGNPYQYSSVQMDKSIMQQVPASSNSSPGNQYAMFPDQVGLQDGASVSRQGDPGKNMFGAAAGQGLNSGFHSENLQQMAIQPKNALMQESRGRQEHLGPSETSLEKSVIQAAPSANVATLDPTEEKILFGSDDSVWDIFGKSASMGSVLDGTDSLGPFPSVQSGSWSALMQSAVAETSSNDIGVQEEWSGLGVQNSEPPSGSMQSSIVNDGSKQQSAWADNNLQNASMLNSKPFPMPTDANINLDFCSVPGVQQLGVQTANEQAGRMQNDLSQRFVQQLTEERSKWLDRSPLQKPVAESAQLFGNVAQSPDMQVSPKNISGHQQGIAVYNPRGLPHNKPNGWNFIESASHSGGAISKNQDIESSLQPSQNSDQKGAMYEERGHGSGLGHPVPDANIESGNVNSGLGSPQVNREGSDLNNFAAITDSGMTRVTKESCRQLPNSNNLNLWKSVDSKGNSGLSRVPSKYQQNQDKGPQTFDSTGNSCLDKGASVTKILDNPNVKETSNDSFRSNISHHNSTGGIRDNVWLDANDPRGGKQKSSVHVSRKPSGNRRFQYHPMGDLDMEVEPSYGTKSVTHSQAISQHVSQGMKGHDQVYFGQSKFTGHAVGESTEAEKGRFPGIQVDGVPSKSSNPDSAPDRSFGGFVPNRTAPMSQNMLELLQKVDQPSERGTATHLSSSERNQSSEMPDAETSDGSVGQFQHNRPSASQGFGLQLGPPSQRFPIPDRANSSQSSPQGVNSLNSVHVSSEVGRKGQTWLGPTASVRSSTHGPLHGEIRDNVSNVSGQTSNKASQCNIQGNVSADFTSDYPYLKSHLQNQHVTGVASQVTPNESVNAPFGGLASQSKQANDFCERAQTSQLGRKSAPHIPKIAPDNDLASSSETSRPSSSNQNHARDPGQQFPVLEAMPAYQPSAPSESLQQGAFTKMLPNVWTNVSAPQHLLGAQSSRSSQNFFKSHPQSNINSETTLPGIKKLDDQIARAGVSGQSGFPAGSAKPQSFVGEEQPAKAQQVLPENDASQNPAITQRDIEAFGRSLSPNSAVHQNYSLLHQVQAMKNTETDPSSRSVKRFKGPDSVLDAQQQESSQGAEQLSYGSDTMMRDTPINRPLVPSGDPKMLRFSSSTGDNREAHLSSNDILAFARNDSQHFHNGNNSAANLRGEHSQISPQMAPSWFDRYGTFKNGQMLPIYDARKIAMLKATEKPFIVGRPSSDSLHAFHSSEQVNAAADTSQLDNAQQSSNLMLIPSEHISPHSLPPDIANQNLVVVRAKKRKSMTFELLPWHREMTQGSQRPQNISVAEVGWAHAANRLIEKVEDEPEMIEDWPPVLRSKRRLILTTHLMQQLLCAPSRVVLSADASKNYETVAYFVARSALGDACSTAYIPESDTAVPADCESIISEKFKMSERNGNQSILKAAEEFISRAKKLENDLQSLDKRASILDLRVECQDLEKFSVINRFAKFHGRGQADGAEASSSSDAIVSAHKFFPRRYVTALPMPRNLPDRVQCLSL
ncbi:Dentin sialophosphoprotein-related, putative [Theobroma cacao]|uniref:Dentin sialophosphoprotein-related, putative n=1 Tax=Theobroma cacao TaxID=3641 RepID=A0A061FY91_THECC|nr:Dentin sialophosphoprotein-related, putative [Theobroma cacao]